MELCGHQKIAIVGSGGSGKSWLASRIAEITGYRLYHLDKEFWQPGWVMLPREEQVVRQQAMIADDRWIIDGNYDSSMELRFAAADLVIFLDLGRVACLVAAARRTGKARPDLPDYLVEPRAFSRDFFDFARWIWGFPNTGRKAILDLHQKFPGTNFLRLKSRQEVNRLVAQWRPA